MERRDSYEYSNPRNNAPYPRSTQGRSDSTSSTDPLLQRRQYSDDFNQEPVPILQPSATFYPTDTDYFTPYLPSGDWVDDEVILTPYPPPQPQYQQPERTRSLSTNGTSATPPSLHGSLRGNGGRHGEARGTASEHSPGALIYTPSEGHTPGSGSIPSASPPQSVGVQGPFPPTVPPPASSLGIDGSYSTIAHLPTATSPTWRTSMSSIQQETPTLSLGRSKTTRTSKTWSKGNMLPVSEDEVLDTSELKGSQVAPLEYSEISGGWVRRAKTSVQNRSGNLMRSLTRKLTTYRPISGEDRDFRPAKFDRARALREEEQKALDEGYVGVDLDMFSGFSSAIPTRTAEAMRNNRGNTEYAYTATGEIVDLSTLHGLGGSYDDPDDETGTRRNSFALTRSSTGNGQSEKSYYFPPDPETPNWKPATMRPIYLSILMFLSLCIIGFCEYLYQYSVSKAEQLNGIPHLTRFKAVKDMPLGAFALWKYFPTVIAVIFGVLVQVTDAEVKRVEPYFQLSRKPKGARAADSLNIEYLTFWAILCPLQAIRHKHWAVMISSVAAILSFAAVPPLQSVFLDLKPDVKGGSNSDSEVKWIAVDKVWTRLLEVVMFLIFILIGVLQWILHRRKSGLVGDPSGIAGIAAMANKSHILMDFKGLDMAGTEQIHKQLRKRTYILHKSSLWQAEYLKEHERPTETVKKQNAHPLLLRLEGGIPLIIYLLTMMAFIALAIHWEKLNTPLQKSTTTWLLTAISISIKMFWEVIDRDLRILQPFYLLYKRHAHSDVLTLDYTGTVPAWIIWKTFKNKHYLLTFVCTITVFNEVLTVCMGSLDPSNTEEEETPLSTTLSLVLAELIMGAQVVGIIIVLLLRRKPFLPRQPGTISSVLAYIYASHMLTDFNNMETEPTEKRRKILASKGKSYGFGWFKGLVDGKWHLGIDEEELARGYTHGEDFLGAMLQTVPTGLDQYETAFNMPS